MVPQTLKRWLDDNFKELTGMTKLNYGAQPSSNEYENLVERISSWAGSSLVKLLGSGEMGQAWLLSDGTVLKLTTDRNEVRAANGLKGRDVAGVVRIYDAVRLNGYELFAIKQSFASGNHPQRITPEIEEKLRLIQRRLEDAGITWLDVQPGNLRIDAHGNVTVFDLGASRGGKDPATLKLEEMIDMALFMKVI